MLRLLLLWCLVCGFGYAACLTTSDEFEPVTVRFLVDNRLRQRRSFGYPARLRFELKTEVGHLHLDLKRSVPSDTRTPLYTLHGRTDIRLHSQRKTTFGIYQDRARGASIIVKRSGSPDAVNETTRYNLFGSFVHNGEHYQLEPAVPDSDGHHSAYQQQSRQNHRVKRQAVPYGNFHGDELVPPADKSRLATQELPPFPGQAVGDSNKKRRILPLKMTKNARSYRGTNRHRRQTTDKLYIEYMVVCDFRNFQRWQKKVGGETPEERADRAFDAMYQFYMFVINGIDVRFRTASVSGPEIRVVLATILVSSEEQTSPWITHNKLTENSVDDAGVLLDFATWKQSVYEYLPTHDHAGLFTGYDIATPSSLNPIGMGYLNSICHPSWAVSEVEEAYSAVTVHIAAHELGHNMGSRHDGSGNACSSSSLYLMAPRLPVISQASMRNHPWTFSTCSQSSIQTFITGLGSSSCLTNYPGDQRLNMAGYESAGLNYTMDQQCNMTFGNDAVLCRDEFYYRWDSLCYGVTCRVPGAGSCTNKIFPFEGTPCGDKKWCQSGSCVYDEDAPSQDESCLFGDDPNEDCSGENVCDESNFWTSQVRCCETCKLRDPTTSTHQMTSSTASQTQESTTISTVTTTPSRTTTPTTTSSTTTDSPPTTMTTLTSKTLTTSQTITTAAEKSVASTSSTMVTSTTSPYVTESTTQSHVEMSVDVQAMVSLFIASAIII